MSFVYLCRVVLKSFPGTDPIIGTIGLFRPEEGWLSIQPGGVPERIIRFSEMASAVVEPNPDKPGDKETDILRKARDSGWDGKA